MLGNVGNGFVTFFSDWSSMIQKDINILYTIILS